MKLDAWMQSTRQRTEAALNHFLPIASLNPTRLHEAFRYA